MSQCNISSTIDVFHGIVTHSFHSSRHHFEISENAKSNIEEGETPYANIMKKLRNQKHIYFSENIKNEEMGQEYDLDESITNRKELNQKTATTMEYLIKIFSNSEYVEDDIQRKVSSSLSPESMSKLECADHEEKKCN